MRISDWSSDVCSSDLDRDIGGIGCATARAGGAHGFEIGDLPLQRDHIRVTVSPPSRLCARQFRLGRGIRVSSAIDARSEENTSELQSLMRISYAVFCLKKKNTIRQYVQSSTTTQQN